MYRYVGHGDLMFIYDIYDMYYTYIIMFSVVQLDHTTAACQLWERQFPVVLPHQLLPWLERNHAWPKISSVAVKEYWDHFRDKVPWGHLADDLPDQVHPLWLWGDDCQYNEQYEKIICVSLGHCCDKNTMSLESNWPLFTIRVVPLMHGSIYNLCVCFFAG